MLKLLSLQHIHQQQTEKCGNPIDFTDDLLVANEALSQLSYSPKKSLNVFYDVPTNSIYV